MKLKIANTVLLGLCFLFLAVFTGTIPTVSGAVTLPEPAAEDPPASDPVPEQTPLSPGVTPEPEAASEDIEAETEGPRIVATTITGEGLLDNDTYYEVDPAELLEEELPLRLPAEEYQVLILHTHATEAYSQDPADPYDAQDPYRTTDPEHSVIRVGEELAQVLSACGLRVLHDVTLHDYPSYSGSYARSAETAAAYLARYPGLRLVIDLHRDALGDDSTVYKTLADIDGVEAAQLMFVMGTDINLEHPRWRENLQLALTLQSRVQERYPTLMRPTVLSGYRYNQHLSPGYLLLEVGTAGNTLREAIAGARLFGSIAGPLLAELMEE